MYKSYRLRKQEKLLIKDIYKQMQVVGCRLWKKIIKMIDETVYIYIKAEADIANKICSRRKKV